MGLSSSTGRPTTKAATERAEHFKRELAEQDPNHSLFRWLRISDRVTGPAGATQSTLKKTT
jgi:hypothetical protein